MSEYYDRDGKPMTQEEWLADFGGFGGADQKRVAFSKVGDAEVSTVWLGLDHSFGVGPPLIFETMIFGGLHSDDQWRYSTEADALAGHERAVALLRADQEED